MPSVHYDGKHPGFPRAICVPNLSSDMREDGREDSQTISGQVASGEETITSAYIRLSEIETQIANTPGEGMQSLAIKLGLHCFLKGHADAASLQSESAHRDLVRLSGRDPAAEIFARFGQGVVRRR